MKRGLKLAAEIDALPDALDRPWTCPDEEGIETRGRPGRWSWCRGGRVRGHAPMKRGLKRAAVTFAIAVASRPWTCPDEEGIETTVASGQFHESLLVRGHAPMKRGLKRLVLGAGAAAVAPSVDMPR